MALFTKQYDVDKTFLCLRNVELKMTMKMACQFLLVLQKYLILFFIKNSIHSKLLEECTIFY